MSRNMIESNRLLFERLARSAPDDLRDNIVDPIKRWIKTTAYEKDFVQYSTIQASDLGAGCHGALVSNPRLDKLWAVLPGQPDLSHLNEQIRGATLVDLHAGWLTVLGPEEWFQITEEQHQREQIVEVLGSRAGAYDYEELLVFYTSYHIIDVTCVARNSENDDFLSRMAAASALVGCSYKLAFDNAIAPILLELLDADVSSLFSASIYRSITASHWVHAYLELYRCIEYFYPATYVDELAGMLGISSQESLCDSLVQVLGWRPHEEQALARILSKVDPANLQELAISFSVVWQEVADANSLGERVAKRIYKLRNSIAHHRVGLEGPQGMDWNQVVKGLCRIIKELQKIYPDGKSPEDPQPK